MTPDPLPPSEGPDPGPIEGNAAPPAMQGGTGRTSFDGLSPAALVQLAAALETGALEPPFPAFAIRRHVGDGRARAVADDLGRAIGIGVTPAGLAFALRLLAGERTRRGADGDRAHLVWTGPEAPGSASRDTSVVVRELFASARSSVVVAGFVVVQGRALFETLARRRTEVPGLVVRMFLNVGRARGDDADDAEILRRFADSFRRDDWPWDPPPAVFYDPRALSRDPGPRAVLHAKCVAVDDERAFVTSANFTEAAQERNIEAGVLVHSAAFARALRGQFEALVGAGALQRVPGLGE